MKFKKTTLKNGIRVITVPMPDNPSVTILVMAEAGSKYESRELSGISHFLEHMVFKGTTRRPKATDISRELDGIGANYNAFTSQEFTGYYAKAASKHFEKILDVVSDMYSDPLFDEKEMAKEKGVIIEEIRMYKDLPQQRVRDLFLEILYGDQPAGRNVAGTEETVKSFTKSSLVGYRKSHYVSSATVVVIAGSFDEEKAIASVEKAFGTIQNNSKSGKEAIREVKDGPKIVTEFKETDQTHLVIGTRTFGIFDPRLPILRVLSSILGKGMSSRLFAKMRDELGICYYIRADMDMYTDHGNLAISAGVDNSRIEEAIRGIISECDRLRDELVPEEEIRKVKDNLAGSIELELETSEARAEYCGCDEVLRREVRKPEKIISEVEAVTAEEVRELAKEIFTNDNLYMAMIGRSKDVDAFRTIVKFRE